MALQSNSNTNIRRHKKHAYVLLHTFVYITFNPFYQLHWRIMVYAYESISCPNFFQRNFTVYYHTSVCVCALTFSIIVSVVGSSNHRLTKLKCQPSSQSSTSSQSSSPCNRMCVLLSRLNVCVFLCPIQKTFPCCLIFSFPFVLVYRFLFLFLRDF